MDWLPDFPETSIGREFQKGDDNVGHASEDKTIDGLHFLMDPKHENDSVDGFLGLGKENNGSGFKMEEVCLGFDFEIWPNYGGLDSYSALEEEAGLKLDIFNGFLDEVDEVEHIYESQDPFPIDTEGTVKVSEFDNDLYVAPNSSSESRSPGISGSIGLSTSLKETVREPEAQNVSCDKVVYEEPFNGILGSISNDCQSLCESEDDKKPLATFIASQAKLGRDQKKCNATRRSDSLGRTISPPSYDLRPRKGILNKCHPKQNTRSDNEVTTSESEEDEFSLSETSKSTCDRRKHQRMWTLSEVVKLVDGISEFGVGRWTNIKNLFFQSASHRTPIDLRDKWRNLLRASYAIKRNNGEVEEESKSHARPVPKHILHRIRELATLHPYPYSKSSPFVSDGSQAQPSVDARTVTKSRKKKKKKKKRC
ncbi:PREDICTED: uncharacterized protein LOC104806488 isoform X2 [Tarenaya hassleriana]|uniref:uncharacterized protein LOC104806488 isoform X2 n=1 Tax=Tarenaya hassleriana TaxID=28532 RepID=UPI00053C765E|nr:PREDICTED: uncharacterized protein LOC104806488 isoform X2 [Tarenaya hassleriana]